MSANEQCESFLSPLSFAEKESGNKFFTITMLTFLFNKKSYKRKSQPDEDTGAKTAFFAKIFIPLRSREKFFNAHHLSFAYVLHTVLVEYKILYTMRSILQSHFLLLQSYSRNARLVFHQPSEKPNRLFRKQFASPLDSP